MSFIVSAVVQELVEVVGQAVEDSGCVSELVVRELAQCRLPAGFHLGVALGDDRGAPVREGGQDDPAVLLRAFPCLPARRPRGARASGRRSRGKGRLARPVRARSARTSLRARTAARDLAHRQLRPRRRLLQGPRQRVRDDGHRTRRRRHLPHHPIAGVVDSCERSVAFARPRRDWSPRRPGVIREAGEQRLVGSCESVGRGVITGTPRRHEGDRAHAPRPCW